MPRGGYKAESRDVGVCRCLALVVAVPEQDMKSTLLALMCALLLVATLAAAGPYTLEDPADEPLDDYSDNNLERLMQNTQKRSCLRRGANCDHRPNDCCYNSSCRCNLWGANCRCQRMGLFQKWGK